MKRPPTSISRRNWLLGAIGLGAIGAGPPRGNPQLDAIRAQGRRTSMEGFDESESAHYLAIGDAPQRFREEALAICEAVAVDYFKQFAAKGFDLAWPNEKLVLVTLMGPKSYARFEGGILGDAIGGHFDLKENRLVMFDFRGSGANPKAPVPEQDNTLALVHETIHQLTYNSGLLDREADVPLCISEGLATYGETWSPRHKSGIGAVNLRRRKGLELGQRQGVKWLPIARLLEDDKLLDDETTQQVAYAESWMLVSRLLKDPARTGKFRDYLAALRRKPAAADRIKVATERLGDLEKLDKDVKAVR